jgi:hypothetical protein
MAICITCVPSLGNLFGMPGDVGRRGVCTAQFTSIWARFNLHAVIDLLRSFHPKNEALSDLLQVEGRHVATECKNSFVKLARDTTDFPVG